MIKFNIPDELLEIGESVVVQIKVNVTNDCAAFQNLCANEITNLAEVSYSGEINDIVKQEQSVFEKSACNEVLAAPTVILDKSTCNQDTRITETLITCAEFVLLEAGTGFNEYTWYYDQELYDAIDAVPYNIDALGNSTVNQNEITVSNSGIYFVYILNDDCQNTTHYYEVTLSDPNDSPANPFENLGEPLNPVCADNGIEIYEIEYCNNDIVIDPQILNANSYYWQKYDNSCTTSTENCIHATSCYTQVSMDETFTIDSNEDAGEYKLTVEMIGGCVFDYYFNTIKFCHTLNTTSNQVEDNKINVYPTLVEDFTTITGNNLSTFKEIKVLNIRGQLVAHKTKLENAVNLDLSNLNSGVYIVVIQHKNKIITRKIVKQ